jgi:PAS domain S-box-containing protein
VLRIYLAVLVLLPALAWGNSAEPMHATGWYRDPIPLSLLAVMAMAMLLLMVLLFDVLRRHREDKARLAASEARHRAMVMAIPDMLFRHDAEGRFLDYQVADSSQLLMPPEAFLGRTIREVMPPELAESAMDHIAHTLSTGVVSQMEYHLELPDGRGYFELRISRINPQEVLVIARDVTARRKTEIELKRSNADLEQFAYAVSHDLRQPLRMVAGHLQILERSLAERLDPDERESLNFARDGAMRMDSMIVSLLSYSRVGRKTDPKAWIESREALDEAMGFLAPAIKDAGAKIHITGEWLRIFASRDEVTRLLQNLLDNAIKYRAEGVSPEIKVEASQQHGYWRVGVSDNGIGIDPAQQDRLFKVFSRLQARTRYEGSGVGLALCRRIIEHHGGRIGVLSEGEGMGSCFWFEFPLEMHA